MKRTMTALVTAAALTMAAVPSAQSMEMEFNMLTGAVFNALRSMNLETNNIQDLSLSEIAQIQLILTGGDSEGEKRRAVQVILDRHS